MIYIYMCVLHGVRINCEEWLCLCKRLAAYFTSRSYVVLYSFVNSTMTERDDSSVYDDIIIALATCPYVDHRTCTMFRDDVQVFRCCALRKK